MGKTIDAKAESKKVEEKKSDTNKSYAKWIGLVALTILIFGFIGYKYLLNFADEIKTKVNTNNDQEISIKAESEIGNPEDFTNEIAIEKEAPLEEETVEAISKPEETVPIDVQEEELSQTDLYQRGAGEETIREEVVIVQDHGLLDKVVQRQNYTIIYLAAKALKNSSDNESFQESLDFLEIAAIDEPTIKSKSNLLRMATKKGLEKKENILLEFKLASEAAEEISDKNLWDNLESSVGELVKITKVEGDVADSYALYKQAEKALEKSDYEVLAKISEKLGAEDLVLKVNNLQRVDETVNFIIEYSKNKMVE